MYIKIFESRKTAKSYMIRYPVTQLSSGSLYIENENHEKLHLHESELFEIIDRFFKEKMQSKEN